MAGLGQPLHCLPARSRQHFKCTRQRGLLGFFPVGARRARSVGQVKARAAHKLGFDHVPDAQIILARFHDIKLDIAPRIHDLPEPIM